MGAAQAFSLIGYSGTTAGGGDTEDRRLDQSVKYYAKYDWLHVGALYQFGSSTGSTQYRLSVADRGDYAGPLGRCATTSRSTTRSGSAR